MAEPRLIRDYLADLENRLPACLVEELADGLGETYRRHLQAGNDQEAAARAALAEFGEADLIAAAFTRAAPARRAARALLGAGPVVGGCWAAALITARAWRWPVPPMAALAAGVTLAAVIALLATAAFSGSYRRSRRAAGAALIGVVLLDVSLSGVPALPGTAHAWPLLVAASLSLTRAAYAGGAWRRIRAR